MTKGGVSTDGRYLWVRDPALVGDVEQRSCLLVAGWALVLVSAGCVVVGGLCGGVWVVGGGGWVCLGLISVLGGR